MNIERVPFQDDFIVLTSNEIVYSSEAGLMDIQSCPQRMNFRPIERRKEFEKRTSVEAGSLISYLYWDRGMNTLEVSRELNLNRGEVQSWMRQAKIPRRSENKYHRSA